MKDEFLFVEPSDIPSVWHTVGHLIKPVFDDNLAASAEDIYDGLCNGDYALWIGLTANGRKPAYGLVTYVTHYRRKTFLSIACAFAFEGHSFNAERVHEHFSAVGRLLDCVGYELVGTRAGWERVLPDLQYQGVVLRAMFE